MPAAEYMNYDRVRQTNSARMLQRCWRKVIQAKNKFKEKATGNKNITAAVIAVKIPFVTYLLFSSRFFYQKLLISLLLFISFFLLFFISSRTSFLSLSLTVILFISFFVYNRSSNNFSNLFFFIIPVFLSFTISNTYLSNNLSYTFSSRLAF